MADRILCDTTKASKRLALLSSTAFGLFPYIFQETDDYGRFEIDGELIKGARFPKVKWVTPEMIEQSIGEFKNVGMLFIWEYDSHRYGYFIRFEAKSGRHLSKRRKSYIPDPPSEELSKFLQDNNHFQTLPSSAGEFHWGKETKENETKIGQAPILDKSPKAEKISHSPTEQKLMVKELLGGLTKKMTRETTDDDKLIWELIHWASEFMAQNVKEQKEALEKLRKAFGVWKTYLKEMSFEHFEKVWKSLATQPDKDHRDELIKQWTRNPVAVMVYRFDNSQKFLG